LVGYFSNLFCHKNFTIYLIEYDYTITMSNDFKNDPSEEPFRRYVGGAVRFVFDVVQNAVVVAPVFSATMAKLSGETISGSLKKSFTTKQGWKTNLVFAGVYTLGLAVINGVMSLFQSKGEAPLAKSEKAPQPISEFTTNQSPKASFAEREQNRQSQVDQGISQAR
jgi:hypothetical protein